MSSLTYYIPLFSTTKRSQDTPETTRRPRDHQGAPLETAQWQPENRHQNTSLALLGNIQITANCHLCSVSAMICQRLRHPRDHQHRETAKKPPLRRPAGGTTTPREHQENINRPPGDHQETVWTPPGYHLENATRSAIHDEQSDQDDNDQETTEKKRNTPRRYHQGTTKRQSGDQQTTRRPPGHPRRPAGEQQETTRGQHRQTTCARS